MPRSLLRVALVCLALMAGSTSAQPVLKAALFEVAPYALREGGELRGLYVDLVRQLSTSAGLRIEIALMPFARVPLALGHREADLSISFSTTALEGVAQPVGTMALVDSVLVTSPARSSTELSSLKGALIGRARGGCQDLAQRADLEMRWVDISGFDSALRMLTLNRLDGLCLTRDVLHHYSAIASIERSSLGAEILVGQRPALLYVRNDLAPTVVARLRAVLAKRQPIRAD